jgi:hypothetical protein
MAMAITITLTETFIHPHAHLELKESFPGRMLSPTYRGIITVKQATLGSLTTGAKSSQVNSRTPRIIRPSQNTTMPPPPLNLYPPPSGPISPYGYTYISKQQTPISYSQRPSHKDHTNDAYYIYMLMLWAILFFGILWWRSQSSTNSNKCRDGCCGKRRGLVKSHRYTIICSRG